MNDINLKELERRAYRSTFEDGIYDLYFGLFLLILAWIPVLESIGVSRFIGYPLLASPLFLIWAGKRYITIPRLGAVEFGEGRKKYKHIVRLVGIIALALMMGPIFIIAKGGFGGSDTIPWIMIALMGLPVFILAVIYANHPRIYIYAAAMLFCIVENEFLLGLSDSPFISLLSFGIVGIVIFIFGLALLIQFLKKYPKESAEATHVG
ncbi:MAG: hypothetical protein R3F48_05975 [Candidatus Zixiibacteriota bacterium]